VSSINTANKTTNFVKYKKIVSSTTFIYTI